MAKDDMHFIIYKILRYLYECNKAGKTPLFSDMFKACELSKIPQCYIAQILEELIDQGYIDGINIVKTKETTLIDLSENARVTMQGVEYLTENGKMKKAEKFARKGFEILLEGVIAAAL